MKCLTFGLLIGFTLGTAASTDAQLAPLPCAASWVLWAEQLSNGDWSPGEGFATHDECDHAVIQGKTGTAQSTAEDESVVFPRHLRPASRPTEMIDRPHWIAAAAGEPRGTRLPERLLCVAWRAS